MSRISGVAFFILFMGFWTAIVGLFDVLIGVGMIHQVQAESFPHVTGTVTHSELTRHSGDSDGGPTYGVDVEYRYQVANHTYHSNTYRFFDWSSSDYHGKRAIVDSLPEGKTVDVFYDPSDPSRATLQTGIAGGDLFIMWFLTPFNMVMLGGWLLGLYTLLPKRHAQTGGVPVELSLHGPRAHFRRLGPLPTAMIAVLATSFVGIFLIGFLSGFSPSMTLMIRAWWALGLVAVIAFIAKFMFNRASPLDLTINKDFGEIELSRGEHRQIPIDRITELDVTRGSSSMKGGGKSYYCYRPTIHYTDKASEERSAELPSMRSLDAAEQFNDWLRDQLGLPWVRDSPRGEKISRRDAKTRRKELLH